MDIQFTEAWYSPKSKWHVFMQRNPQNALHYGNGKEANKRLHIKSMFWKRVKQEVKYSIWILNIPVCCGG